MASALTAPDVDDMLIVSARPRCALLIEHETSGDHPRDGRPICMGWCILATPETLLLRDGLALPQYLLAPNWKILLNALFSSFALDP